MALNIVNRWLYFFILPVVLVSFSVFFFFNDTATTEIYTLSLHDALPIWLERPRRVQLRGRVLREGDSVVARERDRKSTRLNSSHSQISYAVFCLKKKKRKLDRSCLTIPTVR